MGNVYKKLVKKLKFILFIAAMILSVFAKATTCPGATIISGSITFPSSFTAICGTVNNITGAGGAAGTACGSTAYMGGLEALYAYTPASNVTGFQVRYTGQSYIGITIFQGCPTTGGTCLGFINTSVTTATTTAISLTAGITYYIMFDTWPSPPSPCPGIFTLVGTAAVS